MTTLVSLTQGGTGASTAAGARSNLGLTGISSSGSSTALTVDASNNVVVANALTASTVSDSTNGNLASFALAMAIALG